MGKFLKRYTNLLISALLVLASSGLDGVYMSLWMPGAPILGFILNLAADIANMYLSHRVGKLLRSKNAVKQRGAIVLFTGELVAIAYSWLFTWRQLLRVLPAIEPTDYKWLAPLIAGSIPALLAYLSLEAGINSVSSKVFVAEQSAVAVEQESILAEQYTCLHCPASFATQRALNAHQRVHKRDNGRKQPTKQTESA